MSEYFNRNKNGNHSIIYYGYKDLDNGRISITTTKLGIYLKPFDDADNITLDFEEFIRLYDEYLNCLLSPDSSMFEHITYKSQDEAVFGSSIRIEDKNVIFDQLKHTDEPLLFEHVYERTKKNPIGLDRYGNLKEEIRSPVELLDNEHYSFRYLETRYTKYTIPIENPELGKFVSFPELGIVYDKVMDKIIFNPKLWNYLNLDTQFFAQDTTLA